MYYTLTLNPSLDYLVTVPELKLGSTNRSQEETLLPGGKGINVSLMLENLGYHSTVLGFIGGFIGNAIEQSLPNLNLDFITLAEGNSRINVKLSHNHGTEINGSGPKIPEEKAEELLEKVKKLTKEDVLILSGTIPPGLGDDFYEKIMKVAQCDHIVVDSYGEFLRHSLSENPFLVKPNKHELEDFFQVTLKNEEELPLYGKKLQELGAKNVLISLGEEGAYLLDQEGHSYRSTAPKGTLIHSIGSGDAMVAGFLAGYFETHDFGIAFQKALAAGSASAFSPHFPSKQTVEHLLEQL